MQDREDLEVMKIRIYQVDAFTRQVFSGNPAGVVPDAKGLSSVQMQMLAKEMNLSETAFIFPGKTGEYDVHVRFFTPRAEVPMCGHATIAAHYVRAVENMMPVQTIVQKVMAGNLPVEIIKKEDDYQIAMHQAGIQFSQALDDSVVKRIEKALGIEKPDRIPGAPVQVVSTGHSKVFVGVNSFDRLKSLRPDFANLSALSGQIGCNGYLVFCKGAPDGNCAFSARMFGPAMGIDEDPVNGSSGGAMGAYVLKYGLLENPGVPQIRFDVFQGFGVDRPDA